MRCLFKAKCKLVDGDDIAITTWGDHIQIDIHQRVIQQSGSVQLRPNQAEKLVEALQQWLSEQD